MGDWNTSNGVDFAFTRADGQRLRLTSGGRALVEALQTAARNKIGAGAESWDGRIMPSAITVDGNLGRNSLRAIYAAAQAQGAPSNLLQAIQRDASLAQGTPLSRETMTAALLYVLPSAVARDLLIPGGTVLTKYRFQQPRGEGGHLEHILEITEAEASGEDNGLLGRLGLFGGSTGSSGGSDGGGGGGIAIDKTEPAAPQTIRTTLPTFTPSTSAPQLNVSVSAMPKWVPYAIAGVAAVGVLSLVLLAVRRDD